MGTRIQTKTGNGVGDVGGEGSGEEIQMCQPGKEGAGCVGVYEKSSFVLKFMSISISMYNYPF